MPVNDIAAYASAFDQITPFSGHVETGFFVDFLGLRTDANFRTMWGVDPATTGGGYIETTRPTIATSGECWFEQVNWVEAAREAQGSFVMMTLGACYGAQAVGRYLALRALNPMPATLVAVDPVPENIAWTRKHFADNGIDPDEHWIVEAALSADNEPVLFPVGAPGSGTQNCVSSNAAAFRRTLVKKNRRGRPIR